MIKYLNRRQSIAVTLILAVLVIFAAALAFHVLGAQDDDVVGSGINYHGNGGAGEDGRTVYGSESEVVSDCPFDREGHVFTGWSTSADGSGERYMPGDVLDYGSGSVRLYAQWAYGMYIDWSGDVELRYQLTNLEHEQVDINGESVVALQDSTSTAISIVLPGAVWDIDNSSHTASTQFDGVTYEVAFSSPDAISLRLSTIDWNGAQYPLLFVGYDGPVHLIIEESH